jgi:hypothetical protein
MLTIEFLFKDGGLTFAEADTMSGVHRSESTISCISCLVGYTDRRVQLGVGMYV